MAIGVQSSHMEVAMRRRALAGKSGWVSLHELIYHFYRADAHPDLFNVGGSGAQPPYLCYYSLCVSWWIVRLLSSLPDNDDWWC